MAKVTRLALVCAVLMVLASAAHCADVYPTVDFAFNPASFEYSWTVNYTSNVNVNFTTFMVYSSIPELSWTDVSGAWSGGVNENWTFSYPSNGDGTVALRWYANPQRTPSGGAWTGTFKVVIPNSQPVDGEICTYASLQKYLNQPSKVPQMVPEPSSVMALGSLIGLFPLVMRKVRK